MRFLPGWLGRRLYRYQHPHLPPPEKVLLEPDEVAREQARIDAVEVPPAAEAVPIEAVEAAGDAAVEAALPAPTTVLLRYRFPGPMTVGKASRLPSGRIYHLRFAQPRVVEVAAEDADSLLVFKGECCGSSTKQPLFERV